MLLDYILLRMSEKTAPTLGKLYVIALAMMFPVLLLAFSSTHVEAQQSTCPGTPPSNLRIGALGQVTFTDGTSTRLRDNPSTRGIVVTVMPEGQPFEVISGPQCSDGYLWWQLSLLGQQAIGWAAEGDSDSYFIEPLTVIAGTQERIRTLAVDYQLSEPKLIAFLSSDRSRVQLASTDRLNQPFTLHDSPGSYLSCPEWSADGRYVAVRNIPNTSDYSVELIVIDTTTRNVTRNVTLSAGGRYVVWSPDLSEAAYYEPLASEFNNNGMLNRGYGITILNLDTRQKRYISPASETIFFPGTNSNVYRAMTPVAWSPDGQTLAFRGVIYYEGSQSFGFVATDGTRITERTVTQYQDRLDFDWGTAPSSIYYSRFGRLFASSLDINEHSWMLGDSLFPVSSPHVSPDGSVIVIERNLDSFALSDSEFDPDSDLWLVYSDDPSVPWRIGNVGASFLGWVGNHQYLIWETSGEVFLGDEASVAPTALGRIDAQCASVQPASALSIPAILTPLTNPDQYSDGSLTSCETFDSRTAEVIYINGILTNPQAHHANLIEVCRIFADKRVIGIYNLTEDPESDIEEAVNDLAEGLMGTRTGLSLANVQVNQPNVAVDSLVTYLLDNDRPLIIVAHSQGAAIVSAALRRIELNHYREYPLTQDLQVYTFGGYAVSFPQGPLYRHCIREGDPVPIAAAVMSRHLAPSRYDNDIQSYRLNGYGTEYIDEGENDFVLRYGGPQAYLASLTADIWTFAQHSFGGYVAMFGTGRCPQILGD